MAVRKLDVENDLIFDLGLHMGEDTALYLSKGFRVVAIEANPDLCSSAEQRFRGAIHDRRLTIVNKAIARQPGVATFYRNLDKSVWGTIDREWAERNDRFGTRTESLSVGATTMPDLLREFGVPYYLKVDIEGLDITAVEGLATIASRPRYVSIESDKDSFKALRREIQTFTDLGYEWFKVVNQRYVQKQIPPHPALEGKFSDHKLEEGSSGLFGEEAPGKWLTAEQTIEAYKPIFLRYAMTGDERFIRNRPIRRLLKELGFRADWYDTHAKLGARHQLLRRGRVALRPPQSVGAAVGHGADLLG